MFALVPILQIGISTNRVIVLAIYGMNTDKYRQCLFAALVVIFSSVSNEKLWFWHSWTTLAPRRRVNTFMTIMVVFIQPDLNFPAISLSGNNCLANFVKLSATKNGRLCSTTNCETLPQRLTHWWTGRCFFTLRRSISSAAVSSWRFSNYLDLPTSNGEQHHTWHRTICSRCTFCNTQTSLPCHWRI